MLLSSTFQHRTEYPFHVGLKLPEQLLILRLQIEVVAFGIRLNPCSNIGFIQ